MSAVLFGTVNPEINRDADEWAAQCAIAERATHNTVAEMVLRQQRREEEERAHFLGSFGGWAD